MTYKVNDRVFETSTTVGVGAYGLLGAQTGFQSFSVFGTGNLCPYFATDDVNWEVGIGTWTTGPSTLARTTILASSNGGAAVNWGGGITQKIRCGLPAAMAVPRVTTKSVAGGADVTLAANEQCCDVLILTGALTANINVLVDATPWRWIVLNNTTGDFSLTFKVTGQTGIALARGGSRVLYCDAADVKDAYTDRAEKPNLLVNPNWQIDQINEGALYTVTGGGADVQGPDGWSGAAVAAPGVFKLRTLVDPDNAALKCLEITCTTIDAAIAATDDYHIYAAIEGYDAAALQAGLASAQQITLQFKFKSNLNGVYGVSIANSAKNRSYVGIITVPDANEHEYILTLPMDTAGAWLYTNGVGLYLRLTLAAGSNFQAAAGAWNAANNLTTAAQVNFMSSNTNIAYLKRIDLHQGAVPQAYKLADQQKELAKAQRYYRKTFPQGTAVAQAGGAAGALESYLTGVIFPSIMWQYPVPMRAAGTIVTYNPGVANANWRDVTAAADKAVTVDPSGVGNDSGTFIYASATGVAGDLCIIHATSNARLA